MITNVTIEVRKIISDIFDFKGDSIKIDSIH